FFFFQAEDGIRDRNVTGVQTCALPILADELHPTTSPVDVSKTECYYETTEYQAQSWFAPRKVIIQSVRPAGELFFTHSFFVTNLSDTFSPKAIVQSYKKRGTMENY